MSKKELETKLITPNWKLEQTLPTVFQTTNMITSRIWILLKWNYLPSHQSKIFLMIIQTPTHCNVRLWKHLKSQHMHHSSPSTWHSLAYNGTICFILIYGGTPLDEPFSNPCQQKTGGQHTNKSRKLTKISLNMFFHHSLIQR